MTLEKQIFPYFFYECDKNIQGKKYATIDLMWVTYKGFTTFTLNFNCQL